MRWTRTKRATSLKRQRAALLQISVFIGEAMRDLSPPFVNALNVAHGKMPDQIASIEAAIRANGGTVDPVRVMTRHDIETMLESLREPGSTLPEIIGWPKIALVVHAIRTQRAAKAA